MTSAFGGQRSIQLSYGCRCFVYTRQPSAMQLPISGEKLVTKLQPLDELVHFSARVVHRE